MKSTSECLKETQMADGRFAKSTRIYNRLFLVRTRHSSAACDRQREDEAVFA